ncbi:MAG: FHA domain-containing protein, partial [Planctomycetes bacterium]|nr:FHA domain-containing protein [Planctomycetota bacterium]
MAVLIVKIDGGFKTIAIPEGKPVFIGRAKECDVHLPSPAVSRRHSVVVCKNGICGIKDLDSFNGTTLNGVAIAKPEALRDGDTICISNYVLRFFLREEDAGLPAPVPTGTAIRPADATPQAVVADPVTPEQATASVSRTHGTTARTFPNSDLLLPRSMDPEHAVDNMLYGYHAGQRDRNSADSTHEAGINDTAFFAVEAEGEAAGSTGSSDADDQADETVSALEFDLDRPIVPQRLEADGSGFDLTPEQAARIGTDTSIRIKGLTIDLRTDMGFLDTAACPPGLNALMESRFTIYDRLADLAEERGLFKMQASLPMDVETELLRQEMELDNMPDADEANELLQAMRDRHDLQENPAADPDAPPPPPVSPEMRSAEELAMSQWLLIRDSCRTAIPEIAGEAYKLVADEPLARELTMAGISHNQLLGGSAYLLVLEAF